jgi:RNA polymerase sigma-70 factor (ECF subfamily)
MSPARATLKLVPPPADPRAPPDFAMLFKLHHAWVAAMAARLSGCASEVEDIVQDVFFLCARKLHTIPSMADAKPWLRTVTVRVVRKRLQRRKWRAWFVSSDETLDELPYRGLGPDERATLGRLYGALARLPVDEQLAWALRHVEGATLEEVALAELVRSSWIELELTPTPVLPARERVESPPEQMERARDIATSVHASGFRGDVGLEALFAPSVGSPLVGIWLAVQGDLGRSIFLGASAGAWDGATERTPGSIAVRQIAFDPSFGMRWSIVEVAVGARFGWVSLAGNPSGTGFRGDTVSGPLFGPQFVASAKTVGPLRIWLRSGWLLQGERGMVATDQDVAAGGYHVSLGLGLRVGGR